MSNPEKFLQAFMGVVLPKIPEQEAMAQQTLASALVMLGALPVRLHRVLRAAMTLFDLGGIGYRCGGRPFTRMNVDQRQRYVAWIQRLQIGPLLDFIKLMSGLLMFAFYQDPRLWPRIGYAIDADIIKQGVVRDEHLDPRTDSQ
ncbi:MAG: hypothetical protein HYR55_14005 [Acidobacteria bacterium]|nr:hypothetical protein [Acidobacteriota bacterium]MBI3655892.1 hypothetical protein [Acidobacteriota bacterium]